MQNTRESLSAMMDNEVNTFEFRKLMQAAQEQPELMVDWERYNLVSAVLKKQPVYPLGNAFSEKIRQAIATDEQYSESGVSHNHMGHEAEPAEKIELSAQTVPSAQELLVEQSHTQSWKQSLISMAMAASITALVILVPDWQTDTPEKSTTQASAALTAEPEAVQSLDRLQATAPVLNSPVRTVNLGGVLGSGQDRRSMFIPESEMIRSSDSELLRYVNKHFAMLHESTLGSVVNWVPEGYEMIRHEPSESGEIWVFSNGSKAFSINIQENHQPSLKPSVSKIGELLALRLEKEGFHITVVGDMPMLVAERVAQGVSIAGE